MHLDLTENAGNFSFDNRSKEKYEDNPVLSQNVRNNETFAVNETSKEEILNFGSGSGNYEYTGTYPVYNYTVPFPVYTRTDPEYVLKALDKSNYELEHDYNVVHFDFFPKVENYKTTYIKQKPQNETITLCRPLVFCGYDAYEGCKNVTFSTCEYCR